MDFLPFPSTTSSLGSNCHSNIAFQGVLEIVLLIAAAVHCCVESDVVLANGSVLGKTFLSRPDFMASGLLFLSVFHDDLTHSFLEVERTLLHLRVKLTVDKDTSVEVLLAVDAEILVLGHDSFIHVADEVKVLVASVLVAIDFISHY